MDFAPRRLATMLVLSLTLLAGCQTAPSAGGPSPAAIDLEGLWLVTPDAGTSYGAGGITTLAFGPDPSGSAEYLSRSDENGITTCEDHVYAALTENVVLLDGIFYVAERQSADRIVLDNETELLTLERVSGAAPVEPCPEASAIEIDTFDFGTGSWTTLSAAGSRLYFNIDDASDSIVGFNTTTNTLGAPRTYTTSVSGGTHRMVMAARTDDLFYGHCACGGSTSANYFNLATNASVAVVESETDLGVSVGFRFGYFDGTHPVLGGRNRDAFEINELFTLDADTLTLVSQRQVLTNAFITDLALRGSDLIALVDSSLVVIGADGTASQTIKVTGLASTWPRGVEAIGDDVYVLAEDAVGDAVLFEVAMP